MLTRLCWRDERGLKNEALKSRFGSLIAGFLVIALTKNGKNDDFPARLFCLVPRPHLGRKFVRRLHRRSALAAVFSSAVWVRDIQ